MLIFYFPEEETNVSLIFAGSAEGPEVRGKDEVAQFYKSVPCAVETALQQQHDVVAAALDHQDSR